MAGPQVTVVCEPCGHVMVLEREFTGPEIRMLRCHGCEGYLRVELTATHWLDAQHEHAIQITARGVRKKRA